MNISLTKDLEKLIEKKVKSGLYENPSDVVRDALRHLEENSEPEWLEQKIEEGLKGPFTTMSKKDWKNIRQRGMAKLKLLEKKK
ncbi:MAG: type II toxin-antitoxin system ParD family antitoxin [Limisphaerales bacterium]